MYLFCRNEFLAVRNSDGGFYVCQSMQNIYRKSPKIKIRWLSQEKASATPTPAAEGDKADDKQEEGDVYSPDFYDFTG
jgi:hypothetical protein